MSDVGALKMYRGRPLVRCGNIIYYGYSCDRYIIKIQVLSNPTSIESLQLSSEFSVELIDLGSDIGLPGTTIKTCAKSGLWSAIDVSSAWLERKLSS